MARSWPVERTLPVRLEFVVRPPLGAGPSPGSGRPNGHCSVRHGPPCGRRRRSTACGPSTTRGCVPRCRRSGSRQVSVQDHGHSRTAHGREILAAAVHDVLIDVGPERSRDDARNPWPAEPRIPRLELDDGLDKCLARPLRSGFLRALARREQPGGTCDAPTPDEMPGASRGVRRWRPFGFVLG